MKHTGYRKIRGAEIFNLPLIFLKFIYIKFLSRIPGLITNLRFAGKLISADPLISRGRCVHTFLPVVLIFVPLLTPAMADAITLKEAIEQALEKSDGAKIIRETRNRSMGEADKVVAFTRPWLDSEISAYEMGNTAVTNPFVPTPDRYMEASLEASQVLWAGGRITASHGLRLQLRELAELTAISDMSDLQREISRAFVTVLYHQARLKVFQERVTQRRDEKKDAEDLFEAGMVTHLDVREATLNLHRAQDDLRASETEQHTALVDFNVILGKSAAKDLVIPQGRLARAPELREDVHRLGCIYEDRNQIDLQRAAKQLDTSHNHLGMLKGEMLPTLALVAGGDYGGEKQNDFESSWFFGARMTWQLMDGGTRGADIALAQARIRSDRAYLNQVTRTLSGTLNKLNTEVDRLDKRIELQEKNLELSHENYQDARAIYGAGTMTLTRMGDFNLLYAEARFNLLHLYYLENLVAMDVTALLQGSHDTARPGSP